MFPDPESRSAKLTQRAMQVLPDGGRSLIRVDRIELNQAVVERDDGAIE